MRAPEPSGIRPVAWMAAAFVGGVLLHIDRLPLWASVVALLGTLWRLAAALGPIRLPGRLVRALLAIGLLGAVLVAFRTLNGLEAGTALLAVMGAVKLLETQQRRDRNIAIGAALFLLLAACLDRQGLLRAPLYLLHAWLCCAALAVSAHPQPAFRDAAAVRTAGRTLLLAMPLALLLFLFFPRLPGAFWALPRSDIATTGLGDTMSPGSISELSESDDPAFRVWFEGPVPPPPQRYWRGPVLHDFDGYTWRRSQRHAYLQERREYLGESYRYRIALEPHSGNWWYALDTVRGAPSRRVVLTYDYQLLAASPVVETVTYEAVSHPLTRALEPLSVLGRRYDTELPASRNRRSRELALALRARAGSDEALVREVLELFRNGGFEYTLTPPRLDLDSVDDFLFDSRRGFCGHYASAFVSLMRAAGVPARVVTGYLGGEWNPIGGYFIVRQSDAHAWGEVWLDGRGWVRVDPTAVVAPERLTRGILDILPEAASAPARLVRSSAWLKDLSHRWDALNAWWSTRVVKFDFRSQLALLERLGFDMPGWRQLGWVLAAGLTAWLLWITWQFGRSAPGTAPPDRLARAYARLCARLARAGVPRAPHEGPLAYADTLARMHPELAARLQPLLQRYAQLRYGGAAADGPAGAAAIAAFERDVARLRLPGVAGLREPRAARPRSGTIEA